MQTLLVTGGAGFIGGCFVRQVLATTDWRIVNLDKLTNAGNLDSLKSVWNDPRHEFVQGDICDGEFVRDLLDRFRPDAFLNFAAESHVDRSIDGPGEFLQTNVVGTFRMLEAARSYHAGLSESARDAFRFLHVS